MFLNRKGMKWILVGFVFMIIVLQFKNPLHTNPSFDDSKSLEKITTVPPELEAIFARSCNDCHTN